MVSDEELKLRYAEKNPYGEWLDSNLVELDDLKVPNQAAPTLTKKSVSAYRRLMAILTSSTAP